MDFKSYPRHATSLHKVLKISCLLCGESFTSLTFQKKHWKTCSEIYTMRKRQKLQEAENPDIIIDNNVQEVLFDAPDLDHSQNAEDYINGLHPDILSNYDFYVIFEIYDFLFKVWFLFK